MTTIPIVFMVPETIIEELRQSKAQFIEPDYPRRQMLGDPFWSSHRVKEARTKGKKA